MSCTPRPMILDRHPAMLSRRISVSCTGHSVRHTFHLKTNHARFPRTHQQPGLGDAGRRARRWVAAQSRARRPHIPGQDSGSIPRADESVSRYRCTPSELCKSCIYSGIPCKIFPCEFVLLCNRIRFWLFQVIRS